MSVINIQRSHNLPLNELRQKIDQLVIDIEDKLEFRTEWENERLISFRRKGANGNIEIDENNFVFTLRLGMMFRMMKGVIQKEVVAVVDTHLT